MEKALQRFQVITLVFKHQSSHFCAAQHRIVEEIPRSCRQFPYEWTVSVETDADNFVIQNAMTLTLAARPAPSLIPHLVTSESLSLHQIRKCVLVPYTFCCKKDISLIRYVVRVVENSRPDLPFVKSLKYISVLEKERSAVVDGTLDPDLVLKESQNWPLVHVTCRKMDTSALVSLDPLYEHTNVHEIVFEFKTLCESPPDIMSKIISAGCENTTQLPAHSIYLQSVEFRPESFIYVNTTDSL